MKNTASIYRAEILRAVLGDKANEAKAANIERLNQIAEHLAQSEEAQAALRAKGYGRSGMTFLEVVREVESKPRGILDRIFRPVAQASNGLRYPPNEIERYFGETRY